MTARLILALILLLRAAPGQDAASDRELWEPFAKWVEALRPLPPGEHKSLADAYKQSLTNMGVGNEEAQSRWQRINQMSGASIERSTTYWNGTFKLGGGPSEPLRLLQEAIYKRKPGRALDAGMGRGRNAIYLASLGWAVTGYDIARDALAVAQSYAKQSGVNITTIEAEHATFDFGASQWDLILCSYNGIGIADPKWPPIFSRALKSGGIAVKSFQLAMIASGWISPKVLVRYENLDPGVIDNDWTPSLTRRTFRLVVRKKN